MHAGWALSLSAGQRAMGLSLAVVVSLSQRYEACCFIGQDKVLRQGFCWRADSCPSQMELHNPFNPSGLALAPFKGSEVVFMHREGGSDCVLNCGNRILAAKI